MKIATLFAEDRHPRASWWPERLAALLAVAGVVLALLPGFNVRTFQDAASDYKTVYASGTLYLRGTNAYNFPNIETVFRQYGVIIPRSWYAHAPTYPPFAFATLSPVLALPMVASISVWMFLCALSLLVAIWATADRAEALGLSRRWRLLLIVAMAALPIVSFSIWLGNLCIVSAALCVIAVMYTDRVSPIWLAVLFTISLLLKPHVALFLLVGMIVSRNRIDRALAWRTIAVFAGALALFILIFFHRELGLQVGGYVAMVREEIAVGCLNPHNHELLNAQCEITSLESFLGYFVPDRWSKAGSLACLAVTGILMIYVSRRLANNGNDTRLELLGAWSTFGLLATYHRSDDAIVLFILLPWVLLRWRRKLWDPIAWSVVGTFLYSGWGGDLPTFDWLTKLGMPAAAQFMIFRQSALMTILLMLVLLGHLVYQGLSRRTVAAERARFPEASPVALAS